MTDHRAYRDGHPPTCGCIDCAMEKSLARARRRVLSRQTLRVAAGLLFVALLIVAIILVSFFVIA